MTLTFWNYYVLKLLHLETITFSDATLSDINVVLCYVLSQYRIHLYSVSGVGGGGGVWGHRRGFILDLFLSSINFKLL